LHTSKEEKDVVIVLPGLTPGGAERVVTIVLNDWARRGISITLVLLTKTGNNYYDVAPEVEVVALSELPVKCGKTLSKIRLINSICALRNYLRIKKPKILISFLPAINVISLLSAQGLGIHTIVSERNHIQLRQISRFWRVMRWLTYRFADLVTINLESNRSILNHMVSQEKILHLPNPINMPIQFFGDRPRKRTILAVGRLSNQKGYDLLIHAYANCKCRLEGWNLVIVGDGEDRYYLNSIIQDLELTSSIELRSPTKMLWEELGDCSIFVMPSRFEGMPNALLEAIANGLVPLVSEGVGDLANAISAVDHRLVIPSNARSQLTESLDWLTLDQIDTGVTYPQLVQTLDPYLLRNSMPLWDCLITDCLKDDTS
jgi:glycosyltransferase involved in cell wall biosynthesis